jgi:hypothetical protein
LSYIELLWQLEKDYSEHFSFFSKETKNLTPGGQGGPPIFFCDSKPHAKCQNHMITPSGRKVSEAERRKRKRRKKTLIVDT